MGHLSLLRAAQVCVLLCMLQHVTAASVTAGAQHDYEVTHTIIAIAIIPLGLIVMVAGVERLRACVAVLAFFIVGSIFFLIGQSCAAGTTAEQPVAIASGAVFGLIAAALCAKFKVALRVGTAIIGAAAGFVLALFANMAGLRHADASHPNLPFYVLCGLLPCVGMLGGAVWYRYGSAVGLSMLGAFAFVRGVGVFVGGYEDPITFAKTSGPLNTSDVMPWVYVGATALFAVASSVWLCHRVNVLALKEQEEDETEWLMHRGNEAVYFRDVETPKSSSAGDAGNYGRHNADPFGVFRGSQTTEL